MPTHDKLWCEVCDEPISDTAPCDNSHCRNCADYCAQCFIDQFDRAIESQIDDARGK